MAKRSRVRPIEPEEFTATIEDVAFMGEGLARKDGQPVFVAYTIPGEEVVAETRRKGRRYLEAEVKELLQPSPHRVTPPCPYYEVCSGCQWQHIDYSHQLEIKRKLVTDQLQRVGQFERPPVAPTIGCEEPWGYRNHARFTIGPGGQVGFVNKNSRQFVRIDRCLIMDEGINDILGKIQDKCAETTQLSVRYGVGTGDWLIQPTMQSMEITIDTGQTHYEEELLGKRFRVASPSFFQVNTKQAERLVDLALARLNLSGREMLVDAYAGVGTFAVLLASSAKGVIAIEESASAVKDAEVNVAGLPNVRLVQGRTEEVLAQLTETVDAVLLDPPRTGCHEDALRALAEKEVARVVYVSCEPATLARDLRFLCQQGYELLEVQPIDMFPHTYHIEAIATLNREYRGR